MSVITRSPTRSPFRARSASNTRPIRERRSPAGSGSTTAASESATIVAPGGLSPGEGHATRPNTSDIIRAHFWMQICATLLSITLVTGRSALGRRNASDSRNHVLQARQGSSHGREVSLYGKDQRSCRSRENPRHDRFLRRAILDDSVGVRGGEHAVVRGDDAGRGYVGEGSEGIREDHGGLPRSGGVWKAGDLQDRRVSRPPRFHGHPVCGSLRVILSAFW